MEYRFTEENFDTEVLGSDTPVLVDFYADWCGPCKMMMPVVEKLAEKYDDTGQHSDYCTQYSCFSVAEHYRKHTGRTIHVRAWCQLLACRHIRP